MSIQYILFDLDGTITESGPGIMNSVRYALHKYGIRESDPDKLKEFIGPPLAASFMNHYGLSREEALKAVTYYREYYQEKGLYENRLYDGIEESLDRLIAEGYKLAIATSKPEKFTNLILDYFKISDKFCLVAGATMDQSRTGKTEVISYALSKLQNIDVESVIMVGDRENDILGAKNNHLKSIGVLYGYGSTEELTDAGADFIASKPEDIIRIIRKVK